MTPTERVPALPKNARLVLEIVRGQPLGCHAGAHDIHVLARARQAGIGASTVYRALDRLCAAGMIHAVRVPGAAAVLYEPARTGHAHFLCAGCGGVEDVDYDLPDAEIARLNASHGFGITRATLTFSGMCRACATA